MAINLSRNTRVFFTTNVSSTDGSLNDAASGFTGSGAATNTWEIQVLDGYSFSQGTQQQLITLNEAGSTPVRGQRAFNTQLDPVEFSFSTYVRPNKISSYIAPQEKCLWNALLGSAAIDETGSSCTTVPTRAGTTGVNASTVTCIVASSSYVAAGDGIIISGSSAATWNVPATVISVSGTTIIAEAVRAPAEGAGLTAAGTSYVYKGQWGKGTTFGMASTAGSNRNQLQKVAIIFSVDNVLYAVENAALDQASIDFGLDTIATIAWTGKGTTLKRLNTIVLSDLTSNSLLYKSQAQYLTNKLSTLTIESAIGGSDSTSSTTYSIPLTGGNLTIANNINYLVPSNLATVNLPIGYFTGQRAISGNVTAYLRTGSSTDAGGLLNTLLTSTGSTETKFRVQIEVGGSSATEKVEFEMRGAVLQIPTVNVADVVATTVNFTAQGHDPNVIGSVTPAYDPVRANDLFIRYYSGTTAAS